MISRKLVMIPVALFCISLTMSGQGNLNLNSQEENTPSDPSPKALHATNLIKINLTAIALKNYSVQYEKVLTKRISVGASFRTMPSTSIPLKSLILDAVGDDPDTKDVIEKFRMSNMAFTPEARLYLGKKGWGKGFYIAAFYRYASFETNNLEFTYEDALMNQGTITLSGKLKSNTGGILFGSQFTLGKHICLDWWIFGPHYGAGNGVFTGISSQPLDADEQDDIRQQLEDIDIPLTRKTVTVNANGATMELHGPWAGIRAGICLGIRF
ncbi:MAG TPA: hypothetical protein VLJ68_03570 [Chitinophagaceae bacterium]|nr:hypothetical protein [Chitinophagaceae bacterium]